MTDERKPKHLTPIDCDRSEYERQFLRIACVGTNEELSAAVAGLARRGNLRAVAATAPFNPSPSTDDIGDPTTHAAQNPLGKARLSWNS